MGKKIFISYKYGDSLVMKLPNVPSDEKTTARHYVDEIQEMIEEGDHINKGENDGEDLREAMKERGIGTPATYASIISIKYLSDLQKTNAY